MKKFVIPKAKRKLDKLFSLFIHNKYNKCNQCGCTSGQLNCSHIIPRTIMRLRWETMNAEILCVRCHRLSSKSWHQNPLYVYKRLQAQIGEESINQLLKLAEQPFQFTQEFYIKKTKELT